MIIFCMICDEKIFRTSHVAQILCSIVIVVVITGADIGLSLYFYLTLRIIRTASAFQTLIIIYFFLPLPRKYQPIILGVIVSVSHLLMSGIFFYSDSPIQVNRVRYKYCTCIPSTQFRCVLYPCILLRFGRMAYEKNINAGEGLVR